MKNITQFYSNKNAYGGLTSYCKPCHNETRKVWRSAHPESDAAYRQKNKQRSRELHLKRTFNISSKDYDEIYVRQNGRCFICGKHQNQCSVSLHVDHNHVTGKVRGLLCVTCNSRIAVIEDIKFLEKAKRYLEEHG